MGNSHTGCPAAPASAPTSTGRSGTLSFTSTTVSTRRTGPTLASPRTGRGAANEVRRQRAGPRRARSVPNVSAPCRVGRSRLSRLAGQGIPRHYQVDLARSVAAVKVPTGGARKGRSAPTSAFSCSCHAPVPTCTSPVISWPGFRRESGFGPADGWRALIGARRRATRSAHPPLQRRWLHDGLRVRQPGSRAVRARNRRDSPRRPSVRSAECERR